MNKFVQFRQRLGRFVMDGGRKKYSSLPFIDDPRTSSYIKGPSLFRASIDELRHHTLCIKMPLGPLTIAANICKKHSIQEECIKDVLRQFYKEVVFKDALEVLSMNESNAPGLRGIPSWAAVVPWSMSTPKLNVLNMKNAIEAENARIEKGILVEEGSGFWGPVTEKKFSIEVRRLITLINSVIKHGYIRHDGPDGDIPVTVMVKNNGQWALKLNAGMHRTAVFSALYNEEKVVVRITAVCHESDVDAWPNVQNRSFLRETALNFFSRNVDGRGHSKVEKWAEPWIKKLNQ
jgi:hypothetical protein